MSERAHVEAAGSAGAVEAAGGASAAGEAAGPQLKLFVMAGCPFCRRVLGFMAENGIQVEQADIAADPAARETLAAEGGKVQVPCLFIDGKPLYESADIVSWMKEHML